MTNTIIHLMFQYQKKIDSSATVAIRCIAGDRDVDITWLLLFVLFVVVVDD